MSCCAANEIALELRHIKKKVIMPPSNSPLWLVQCIDDTTHPVIADPSGKLSGSCKRISNHPEHSVYQRSPHSGIVKISSGPLISDDGTTAIGSAFILQGTRAAVDSFSTSDPFFKKGVWDPKGITISRYFPVNGIQAVDKRPPPRK